MERETLEQALQRQLAELEKSDIDVSSFVDSLARRAGFIEALMLGRDPEDMGVAAPKLTRLREDLLWLRNLTCGLRLPPVP